ncbi:MAG: hypothetical protein A2901_03125 [Elusimicrobia bacterium RIFCSPLOWO2_01_FULL_54_10]|nr:MAG: hypothetical protein A2901_03125 [Elusimicrobia bacterium RIFCSPLOWO2_01_FULL_54_10]
MASVNDWENDDGFSEINVTPLVDVCLVLVLIFLVTSPLFTKTLVPVRLPQVVAAEAESKGNITVSISTDEGFAVNENLVPRKDLSREIKNVMKASGISFILIRADERISYGDVKDVMKIAKALGAKRIAFATTPKSS